MREEREGGDIEGGERRKVRGEEGGVEGGEKQRRERSRGGGGWRRGKEKRRWERERRGRQKERRGRRIEKLIKIEGFFFFFFLFLWITPSLILAPHIRAIIHYSGQVDRDPKFCTCHLARA